MTKKKITEKERKELRENAVAKEFYRLGKLLRKKSRAIIFYRVFVALLVLFFCSFLYLRKHSETNIEVLQAKLVSRKDSVVKKDSLPIKSSPVINQKTYYTVFFKNEDSHALAQFEKLKRSQEFCRLIKKMELPDTKIISDTIFRDRNKLAKSNYPYRYAVQLGAYEYDFLKDYKANLIWIISLEDNDYYKYRVAPFYGYSTGKAFLSKIKLKETYILPYAMN
nr:hypothetical protein [uncultured Marinifilum sp.]